MLIVLAALLIVFAWYSLFWQPLHAREAQLERNIERQTTDLAWLQAAATQFEQNPNAAVIIEGRNQSLLSVTDLAAKSARLKQQMGNLTSVTTNTVRVSFDDAPYEQLLKFIYQLDSKYGITVSNLVVDKQDKPGLVDARLTVSRPQSNS